MEIGTLLIDDEFLPVVQNLISKAEKRIYLSTFKAEMTTKPRGRRLHKLFDTVIEKSRLGLDVRLLISKRENYGHVPLTNLYAVRELKANKVKVRHLRDSRLCHAKIILIDEFTSIIGSHNLSIRSCHNNFEVSYMIRDLYVAEHLLKVYKHVWDNAKAG